jgi:hypothetical protein
MKRALYFIIGGIVVAMLSSASPIQSVLAVDTVTLSDTTIPLGGTLQMTLTNTLDHTIDAGTIAVQEPDGDICRVIHHNIPAGDSYTVTYPTDFHADLGSVACDTNQLGEFHVKGRLGTPTNEGRDNQQELLFTTSFFVVPESPIGVAALMGSSLAALGGFVGLRHLRTNKN